MRWPAMHCRPQDEEADEEYLPTPHGEQVESLPNMPPGQGRHQHHSTSALRVPVDATRSTAPDDVIAALGRELVGGWAMPPSYGRPFSQPQPPPASNAPIHAEPPTRPLTALATVAD